jgi:hypothetical protein
MPVSNYVIRRYTPPTCTLEILAQSSPLSRWMGKSVLQNLRFELRFDDPQTSEEQKILIRGDRDQLEALCTVVTNYVQEFLHMSPEKFWTSFSHSEDSTNPSEESLQEQSQNNSVATKTINSFSAQIPGANIHIQPSNYLTHNLFLGSLAHQISGNPIQLSLLQLFDLASALDEYSEDVIALPYVKTRSTAAALSSWIPVAAVVVFAVGLMPFTFDYAANRSRQQQQTANKSSNTAPKEEKVALEPSLPPSEKLPVPKPALTPPDGLSFLSPTSQQDRSVSIPGSTLPPTTPTFVNPNLPINPQTSASSELLGKPQTATNPAFPKAPPTSPDFTLPTALLTPPDSLTIPSTTPNTTSQPPQNTPPFLQSPNTDTAIQPNPAQSNTLSIPNSGTPSSKKENVPSSSLPSTGSISGGISSFPTPVANVPGLVRSNTSGNTESQSVPSVVVNQTPSLATRLRESRDTTPTQQLATASSTEIDPAQLTQARDFLQKRWQPPTGLKQTLEYSLIVGVDGTIERIFPLGKAARDFVDRSGMPLIGEPFVSPNRNGQILRMRAVLNPDGKVQTFAETD